MMKRIGKAGATFGNSEFERELLRERIGDGRKPAMGQGREVRSETQALRLSALRRRAAGQTLVEIGRSYAVDVSMISRLS